MLAPTIAAALASLPAGQPTTLTIARNQTVRLVTIEPRLLAPALHLAPSPDAPPDAIARRAEWLAPQASR